MVYRHETSPCDHCTAYLEALRSPRIDHTGQIHLEPLSRQAVDVRDWRSWEWRHAMAERAAYRARGEEDILLALLKERSRRGWGGLQEYCTELDSDPCEAW
jgi:hypothetical protein